MGLLRELSDFSVSIRTSSYESRVNISLLCIERDFPDGLRGIGATSITDHGTTSTSNLCNEEGWEWVDLWIC